MGENLRISFMVSFLNVTYAVEKKVYSLLLLCKVKYIAMHMYVLSCFSCVQLFATLRTP